MSLPASLREYDRPADRIRLHRQGSSNPILVVEGVSDKRLCEKACGNRTVDCFPVGSRGLVLDTVRAHEGSKLKDIAYVVDRDFDYTVAEHENLFETVISYDNCDLEAMLFNSRALAELLDEFGSAEKLANFGGVDGVRSHIVEAVGVVSRMRRANALQSWGLIFDKVDIPDKYRNGSIVAPSLTDALKRASPDSSASRNDILESVNHEHPICPLTEEPMFRGRDALSILGILLKRQIGTRRDGTSVATLESALRLTISATEIQETPWFKRLQKVLPLKESAE